VALAYSRFDEDARAGAHREYLDSIADFADGRGYRVPGEFVVCSARRAATPDAAPPTETNTSNNTNNTNTNIHRKDTT
jgi:hypothetical protein